MKLQTKFPAFYFIPFYIYNSVNFNFSLTKDLLFLYLFCGLTLLFNFFMLQLGPSAFKRYNCVLPLGNTHILRRSGFVTNHFLFYEIWTIFITKRLKNLEKSCYIVCECPLRTFRLLKHQLSRHFQKISESPSSSGIFLKFSMENPPMKTRNLLEERKS